MDQFAVKDTILTDVIADHGRWRANRAALICDGDIIRWGEFSRRINKVANGLMARGLKKGDRVSLLSGNIIEVPEIIFGTVKAGGIIVPLSAMVTGEALARMINDSESRFIFALSSLSDIIDQYRENMPSISKECFFVINGEKGKWISYKDFLDTGGEEEPRLSINFSDSFNIMYTSGTTGVPKGILHTHFNRFHFAVMACVDFQINSESIGIASTALYANGTWLILLSTLYAGGKLIIMPRFDSKEFLQLISQQGCTHTFMAPTQFGMLLDVPDLGEYNLNSMRCWVTAGAPMRHDVKKRVMTTFPGDLIELWGLTEGVATTIKPTDMIKRMDSVGLPVAGHDIRIIDDDGRQLSSGEIGEIVGYSPVLMSSYYNLPEMTKKAIWVDTGGRTYVKTGDMGKIDDEGFLYILDRKKDMIVSGGVNIFASDIEEVLVKHDAVKDVAVIGIPHDKWGETPLALVILKEGAKVSGEEIKEWVNGNLAKYQRVSEVEIRTNDFPRNALGKVLKRHLREPYWQKDV